MLNRELEGVAYTVTEASKQRFAAGQPGQGFVGFVDTETNELHLFPAFHKNDGMSKTDIDGNELTPAQYVETSVHRGKQAILSAHGKAGAKLFGREECMRKINEGKLLGFGLWKAGISLLIKDKSDFLNEDKQYTPDEYLLVRDKDNYKLYYVGKDSKSNLTRIEIDISSINNQIAKIAGNNVNRIGSRERKEILQLIQLVDIDRKPQMEAGVKYFKASSTSLNTKSMTYDPLFMCHFILKVEGHLDHAQGAIRELMKDRGIQIVASLLDVDIITTAKIKSFVSISQLSHWTAYDDWQNANEALRLLDTDKLLSDYMMRFPNNIVPLYKFFKNLWAHRSDYNLQAIPTLYVLCAIAANNQNGLREALSVLRQSSGDLEVPFELITRSREMYSVYQSWVIETIQSHREPLLGPEILQHALESFCQSDASIEQLRTVMTYIFENNVARVDFGCVLESTYRARSVNNLDLIYSFYQKNIPGFKMPFAHHYALLGKSEELRDYLATVDLDDQEPDSSLIDMPLLECAIKSGNIETVRVILSAIHTDIEIALYLAIMCENADIFNLVLATYYPDESKRDECLCQFLQKYLVKMHDVPTEYGQQLIAQLTGYCQRKNTNSQSKLTLFDIISQFYTRTKAKLQPELRELLRVTLANHDTDTYTSFFNVGYVKNNTSILHMAVILEDIPVINIIMDSMPMTCRLPNIMAIDSEECIPITNCLEGQPVNLDVLDSLLNPLDGNAVLSLLSHTGMHARTIFHDIAEQGDVKLLEYINSFLKRKLLPDVTQYLSLPDNSEKTPLYLAAVNARNPEMIKYMVSACHLPPSIFTSHSDSSDSLLASIIRDGKAGCINNLFDCYTSDADKMHLIFDDPGIIDSIIRNSRYDVLNIILQQIISMQPENIPSAMQKILPNFMKAEVLRAFVFTTTSFAEKAERLTTLSALVPESKKMLDPLIRQLSKPSSVQSKLKAFKPIDVQTITRQIEDALIFISDLRPKAVQGHDVSSH